MVRTMSLIATLLILVTQTVLADSGGRTAAEVAKRSFESVGGDAWIAARYLEFTFNVERDGTTIRSYSHRWDRVTGDYRVFGSDREGKAFDTIFKLDSKKGRAWLAGEELSDSSAQLEQGYARFINDSYWLLMPLKLEDPGVNLEFVGSRTDECGRTFDGVKLSFENVGLTPGDQYWVWIDRDTGLVDLWQMQLEDMKPEDPKREYLFREYQRIGGLLLSMSKPSRSGGFRIWFSGVVVRPDVPAEAFKPPGS